jgi:hypothetical protein
MFGHTDGRNKSIVNPPLLSRTARTLLPPHPGLPVRCTPAKKTFDRARLQRYNIIIHYRTDRVCVSPVYLSIYARVLLLRVYYYYNIIVHNTRAEYSGWESSCSL